MIKRFFPGVGQFKEMGFGNPCHGMANVGAFNDAEGNGVDGLNGKGLPFLAPNLYPRGHGYGWVPVFVVVSS